MRIYWAGPLFSAAEREWNADCAAELRENGLRVDLPQEMNEKFDKTVGGWQRDVFNDGKRAIEQADVVVAVADGIDMDAGTAWECGYAYALGIPLVFLHTDMRCFSEGELLNLMLYESADAVVTSISELLEILLDWESMIDGEFTAYAVSKGRDPRVWLAGWLRPSENRMPDARR